jgi:hypothetical protein
VSRRQLEEAVDQLAEQHTGEDFAEAVRRYSEGLDEDEREELQAVLLERARLLDSAVDDRFKARTWFSRMMQRIEESERRRRSPPDDASGR